MKKCYINGLGNVSAQNTFETDFLEDAIIFDADNVLYANQPSYKEMIPPAASRRMAKGVKMGIAASTKALAEANVTIPDAIITGTGMGCVEDSEKFLKAIIENKEEFLTPTSFIQSTHNTVGAQIALGLQCKGYNFTYVNGSVSLETALLDAKIQVETQEENTILVGGIDETAPHTIELYKLIKVIKNEEDAPFKVLNSTSEGIIFSEGATFFTIENQQKSNSYAVVEAIKIHNSLDSNEVESFVTEFLSENNCDVNLVDVVVLGNNGDVKYDDYYKVSNSIFKDTAQVYYKHLSGEYNTASGFGLWCASKIMKNQIIPEILKMNNIVPNKIETILLYNQYQGKDHSLILLKKC
jgi:3-oxoacyl-(acyl-carrier-protein) synthase